MEYYIIIAASLIIILSYLFNRIASTSNIPSVLMLIALGAIGKQLIGLFDVNATTILTVFEDIKLLEILGTLGLILIVLEAALELKIEEGKYKLIIQSFLIALVGLFLCMFLIGGIFYYSFTDMSWINALIYATPLSIISSAIVIPSVERLGKHREEFHIYESTFSDILGIMAFYFLVQFGESENQALTVSDYSFGLIATIVISVLLSYALIYLFQNLETKVKLFLMIGVLFLLFSVGKLMHLSSLLIILIFGVVLNNYKLFFAGPLRKYVKPLALENIKEAFLMITMESAFVIRTFFFVIFGFSIALSTLLDIKVVIISVLVLVSIYGSRILSIFVFNNRKVDGTVYIAPRGLITLLLYYSIPDQFQHPEFSSGILLFVIIVSSLVMTYGLVKDARENEEEGEIAQAE